mmetsp:Transcript_24135/g.35745  ORF Transcript_24135/g.35745 Transcript_24135/m.35745 type:complete len:101 (+) Transcript_24135:2306-2608(+)
MAGHGRRLGSGRKGDPGDRAVIKAAVSLHNKRGNVRQHKAQVDAKHDPLQEGVVPRLSLLEQGFVGDCAERFGAYSACVVGVGAYDRVAASLSVAFFPSP